MMAVFFFFLMKRVLNFMRNPKLAHILVHYDDGPGDLTVTDL